MNTKVGFIGFGNMAQAMAKGFLQSGQMQPGQIFACAHDFEKLCGNTKPTGMVPCETAAEVVDSADVIIVAVKPHLVENVMAPVAERLKGKILLSVAAGFPFERYEQFLPEGTHHISTMPNTPVSVGEGIVICEKQHSLDAEEFQTVQELLALLGLVETVETKQFSTAGTLSGCGPAFACLFIEALADGAVKNGLSRKTAYRLASQMVSGTGKMQLATGTHPGEMKDAVCSPGGTTIIGVTELERGGMRAAVINAIDAIENR